ncbi:MAG: hypothetical protein RLY57_290 [Candidatus Parcubacteria bacterium]|jgi:hypothetical protein
MKTFFKYIGTALFAVVTTLTTGCSNVGGTRIVNAATPTVGGSFATQTVMQTVEKTVAPAAKAGLEVYGQQPSEPSAAAKANQTTWGQTFNGAMAYNEMRPHNWARLETPSADTRILLDTSTGYIWKVGCHNRIVVAQSRTVTEQVPQVIQVPVQQQVAAAPAGGVHVDNSVRVETGLNNLFAGATALAGQVLEQGLVQRPIPGGCYPQPQPRYRQANCPPPQRVACPPQMRQRPPLPCPPQQRPGKVQVRVHNVNVNGNYNGVVPTGSSSYRPSYNSNSRGSNYGPSGQGRPFGNGSNNAGYARGNPGLSYF